MVAGKIEKVSINSIDTLSTDEYKNLQEAAIRDYNLGEDTEIEPTESSHVMLTTDERCNYVCGSKGIKEDMERIRDNFSVIDSSRVDYNIVTEKDIKAQEEFTDNCIDKRNSLSYMSVTTVEEGELWYRKHFPQIPDDLYPVMARWNFGDLSEITKKDIKNDKKRLARGKKAKVCKGLEVKKGPIVLKF